MKSVYKFLRVDATSTRIVGFKHYRLEAVLRVELVNEACADGRVAVGAGRLFGVFVIVQTGIIRLTLQGEETVLDAAAILVQVVVLAAIGVIEDGRGRIRIIVVTDVIIQN